MSGWDDLSPSEWLDGDHDEAMARARASLPPDLVGPEYEDALDAAYVTEALAIQTRRRAERAAADVRRRKREREARHRAQQRRNRRTRYEWARMHLLDAGVDPTDGAVAALLTKAAADYPNAQPVEHRTVKAPVKDKEPATVSARAIRQWREAGDID